MNYEAHITVDGRRRERWVADCVDLQVKPIAIQLEQGDHHEQIMCTLQVQGIAENAMNRAAFLAREFIARGHVVKRVKVERELEADHVGPAIDASYYEAHIKLPGHVSADTLFDEVYAAGLALSWSERNTFLTDRCIVKRDEHAVRAFQFSHEIVQREFPQCVMECEAVVFDSTPSIDDGWPNADLRFIRSIADPMGYGY